LENQPYLRFHAAMHSVTRRHFLGQAVSCLGAAALASLRADGAIPARAATAKRVIFLHMAGGPSQLELFDYKPTLRKLDGHPCPESLIAGRRFAFLQGTPDLLGPQAEFAQHGQGGAWVSERLPHFAEVADEVTFIKTLRTDQFNHAPAQLFVQTGSAEPGRPSFGSWVTYGLGSANENLPAFLVLLSGGKTPDAGKSIWGAGFLPGVYQGVQCQTTGSPILFSENPPGVSRELRRATLDTIAAIDRERFGETSDPEILTRIEQYELAFRMQTAVPEAMDISREPDAVRGAYGAEPGVNSFANNCLLARRLAERGVRFIQLYDWGWDSHGSIEGEGLRQGFLHKTASIDRPLAALLGDLKQRGLLEETLVVWTGEFGRTPMMENRNGKRNPFVGRDHHPYAFTAWLAGGGVKRGHTHGETDEFGCLAVRDPVHVHDLQATILAALGLDHTRLVYPYEGRDFRLTDVHGRVVREILA
jgi:hypothetical protein